MISNQVGDSVGLIFGAFSICERRTVSWSTSLFSSGDCYLPTRPLLVRIWMCFCQQWLWVSSASWSHLCHGGGVVVPPAILPYTNDEPNEIITSHKSLLCLLVQREIPGDVREGQRRREKKGKISFTFSYQIVMVSLRQRLWVFTMYDSQSQAIRCRLTSRKNNALLLLRLESHFLHFPSKTLSN